jgi:hypothetical protein
MRANQTGLHRPYLFIIPLILKKLIRIKAPIAATKSKGKRK